MKRIMTLKKATKIIHSAKATTHRKTNVATSTTTTLVSTAVAPQTDAKATAALQLLDSETKPLTLFQRKVLQALCRVPAGQVTTYKHLAQYIQCRSTQAVGQALRRNPYAPMVPCHRVVATTAFTSTSGEEGKGKSKTRSTSTMSPIGGFGGCLSGEKIEKKIQLLQQEGVKITSNRGTIDPSCLYTFH